MEAKARRLDLSKLWRFASRGLAERPVHMINLIDLKNRNSYAWYLFFLRPLLYVLGGKLEFVGVVDYMASGEGFGKFVLIFRQQSHTAFLAMVTSLYYRIIGGLRTSAVERFQLSISCFQNLSGENTESWGSHVLAVRMKSVQSSSRLESLGKLVNDAERSLCLVYAAHEQMEIDFIENMVPSDPNPTPYKTTLFFKFREDADETTVRGFADKVSLALAEAHGINEASVLVIRRSTRQREFPIPRLMDAKASPLRVFLPILFGFPLVILTAPIQVPLLLLARLS